MFGREKSQDRVAIRLVLGKVVVVKEVFTEEKPVLHWTIERA